MSDSTPPNDIPPETVDVGGVPTPMTFFHGDRQVSKDEWDLAHGTNGTTLRAACEGEGLPVSGTNAAKARRLVTAGLTAAYVNEHYGWRARRAKDDANQES